MNKSVTLKLSSPPKIWGELAHSNQFLKIFSLVSLVIAVMTLLILAFLINRPAMVLTLAQDASSLSTTELPKPEDQIRAAIYRYLEKRYNWGPDNVGARLRDAQVFILPQNLNSFESALVVIARFSIEKLVTQRTFVNKIQVDLGQETAYITGDRVTAIQGLKAAGDLKLVLHFDSGPRTPENPWGLYITKEREEP